MLQLKFISEAHCQEVATSLEAMGLPVRAGFLLDRPASQRLSTSGSWSSMTPPNSQIRNAWSSHGSSSSQTVQTLESVLAAGELAMESQSHRIKSIPEESRLITTAMSSLIPNPLTHSLEYPTGFPGTYRTRVQSPSAQPVETHGTPLTQQYQQNQPPSQPNATEEFRFYPARRSTGTSGRVVPTSSSASTQQLHSTLHGTASYANRDEHGASPMQSQATGIVAATNLSPTRRESDSVLNHLRSPESLPPLSIPSQQNRGAPTTLAHNMLGPPPIPERPAPTRGGKVTGKRKLTGPSRPPTRQSERLAIKHVIQGSEHLFNFQQQPNVIHPSPLGENSDLPPRRELPFPVSKTQRNISGIAEEAQASEELPSMAAPESQLVAEVKVAAKKTRKAPSKSVKGNTSQTRKRAPKKTKAVGPVSTADENGEQHGRGPASNPAPPLPNEATTVDVSQQSSLPIQQSSLPITDTGQSIPTGNNESGSQAPVAHPNTNGCLTCQTRERDVLVRPAMSREDIENLVVKTTKETLGSYFAGVGSYMKDISTDMREISMSMKEISANFRNPINVTEQAVASS